MLALQQLVRCNTPPKVQLRFVVSRRGFMSYDNSCLFGYISTPKSL